MEKLIELLNEYIEEYKPRTNLVKEITDGGYFVNNRNDNDGFLCETIMSKKFGFIQWLVKNDKINFKKFDGDNYDYLENPIGSNNYDTVWDYKTIIKWLSISDTPIEDLISYLK